MFDPLEAGHVLDSIGITRLDGTSAEMTFPDLSGFSGGTVGHSLPAVSAIVSLRTPVRGPRGRGRIYIGPITEEGFNEGMIGDAPTLQTAWSDFVNNIAAHTAYSLVIASYKHLDYHGVTTVNAETAAATQRRRQNQLR